MTIEESKTSILKLHGADYNCEVMLLNANPTRGVQFVLYNSNNIKLYNEDYQLLWERKILEIKNIEVDILNNSSHEHQLIINLCSGKIIRLSHTGRKITKSSYKILDNRYQQFIDDKILGADHFDYEPIVPVVFSREVASGYYQITAVIKNNTKEPFMIFDRNGLCIYEGLESRISFNTVMYQAELLELRSRNDIQVESIKIKKIAAQKVIHFIGDSTLANQQRLPLYGWAQLHPLYTSTIVNNLAYSARSLKSFCFEGRFNQLLNEISAGDIVVIGFGHNDIRTTYFGSNVEEYIDYLKYYINLIKSYDAIPIVTIPIAQRHYNQDKILINTHEQYEVAILDQIKDIKIVNLNKLLMDEINKLGYEASKQLFNNHKHLELVDNTHLSKVGAKVVNELFIKEVGNDI